MAKQIPWIKFNPTDFMLDENVMLMCDESIGLYMRILCHSWREGSIPKEPEKIMRLFGLSKHKFNKLWKELSPCFFEKENRLYQTRLAKELSEARKYFDQKSDSGKLGAEKRWHRHDSANSETMQDQDLEREEDIKPSKPSESKSESPGPPKTLSNNAGLAVSQVINGHVRVFDHQHGDGTPKMKSLLNSLLCVRELPLSPEEILGLVLQAKRGEKIRNRVSYCIKIIKDPKFVVADGCRADAKKLLRKWADDDMDPKVRKLLS